MTFNIAVLKVFGIAYLIILFDTCKKKVIPDFN